MCCVSSSTLALPPLPPCVYQTNLAETQSRLSHVTSFAISPHLEFRLCRNDVNIPNGAGVSLTVRFSQVVLGCVTEAAGDGG